jgi:hypothetical protein
MDALLGLVGQVEAKKSTAKKKKEKQEQPLPADVATAVKNAEQALIAIETDETAPKTWANWMKVAEGFSRLQGVAVERAGGASKGAKYSQAMNRLLKDNKFFERIDRFTRSRLMTCYKQRNNIEPWLKENTNKTGWVINNPAVALVAYKARKDAPKQPRKEKSVNELVTALFDSFRTAPMRVARDFLIEHCPVEGHKEQTNLTRAQEIADFFHEQVEALPDTGRHAGYEFLVAMDTAIATVIQGLQTTTAPAPAPAPSAKKQPARKKQK